MATDKLKAPTAKIVQIIDTDMVLCEDGSVWEVTKNGLDDKQWHCLIEPFNGTQYEYSELPPSVRQGKGIG